MLIFSRCCGLQHGKTDSQQVTLWVFLMMQVAVVRVDRYKMYNGHMCVYRGSCVWECVEGGALGQNEVATGIMRAEVCVCMCVLQ